ncbi:DUF6461 domain-containing protein [Streptosporangium saharense]|uniref:DUF6461 domain-containing protein n=1 Tax=Streptosporangium saharense TaxID=1706840 RepID=UPI00332A623F
MRKIMPADYAWEKDWQEEIYTVTFVRGLDERETLRRFGVADDDIHPADGEEAMERVEETDGCCDMVLVTRAGDWTIACGSTTAGVSSLSMDTAAGPRRRSNVVPLSEQRKNSRIRG